MSYLKRFEYFINENKTITITVSNIEEYKDKLIALLANEGDEKLKKGFDFTISNLEDYRKDEMVFELVNGFLSKINNLISNKYPKFYQEEDKGYSGNKFTGKNYEKTSDLRISELSKMIKKELSIEYPEWKFSVKSETYSGGQSLRVSIDDVPYNPYSEYTDNRLKNNITDIDYDNRNEETYNKEFKKDRSKIKSIANQYNFDDSDSQSDYFHVNYYCFVDLNDDAMKGKYYPENEEYLKTLQWRAKYAEKDRIRKEAFAKKKSEHSEKFKFKKGEECIFPYTREGGHIPVGEYKAIILKAPSAKMSFPKYEIRYFVDKKKVNGEIITLENPIAYITTIYDDTQLKKID